MGIPGQMLERTEGTPGLMTEQLGTRTGDRKNRQDTMTYESLVETQGLVTKNIGDTNIDNREDRGDARTDDRTVGTPGQTTEKATGTRRRMIEN